jgi:hypothetical protein
MTKGEKKNMKTNRTKLAVVVLVVSVIMPMKCFAFNNRDFQYWNTESLSYKINKDWKIGVEEELRFGDNVNDFYYEHTDAGITYLGLAEWIDLGINYRLIFEEKKGNWQYENRPHGNVTLKYSFEGFKFSDRNRIEYRDKEDGKDGWRYRNKFTIKHPIKVEKFEFSPYVADEIFMDFVEEKLDRNRLYAGIDCKILKNLGLDIFYLWQASEKDGSWTSYNVLGTKIKLSF